MLKNYAKRQNLMRILVLPLKKIGGVRAPLAPPVPTTLIIVENRPFFSYYIL